MKAKTQLYTILFLLFAVYLNPCYTQPHPSHQLFYQNKPYSLYPFLYDTCPQIPSPYTTVDGTEFIICLTLNHMYTIVAVTVENGEPLDYKNDKWYGKGLQLKADNVDFPTLVRTGLHSEDELEQTKTITGKPVAEITSIARPGQYSGAGFISQHEDIISVLKGDNMLVQQLGKTHSDMAKPLFHVFNLIQAVKKDSQRGYVKGMLYNNRTIYLTFIGSKGWQESIFNDEILGYWQIEIRREMETEEKLFLSKKYPDLSTEKMSALIDKLSFIHTGEMVPFYIQRYGFYEGHTSYRADPIAIAFIFGLNSLEDIDQSFSKDLLHVFTTQHIKD